MSTNNNSGSTGVMQALKGFVMSSKIMTKDLKMIEIHQIKLKYILVAVPEEFQPPDGAKMLVTSSAVQHFLKHNMLSIIFAMKNNLKKHFLKIINNLTNLISTINYSQAIALTPNEQLINRVISSNYITISQSGRLSIIFDQFTSTMFSFFASVLNIGGDFQEEYVLAAKALYEDDEIFESSTQMQVLLMIVEEDIYQLEQIISSEYEKLQNNHMKLANNDVSGVSCDNVSSPLVEDRMEVDISTNTAENESTETSDQATQETHDDVEHTGTSAEDNVVESLPPGIIEQNDKNMPDFDVIDLVGYKNLMNIKNTWKPVSDVLFIVNENQKLINDDMYRMKAILLISSAIRDNKLKYKKDQVASKLDKLDYELDEVTTNMMIISNVNLFQLSHCGSGLIDDLMEICCKFGVVLTNGQLLKLGNKKLTKLLNFDLDGEGRLKTGCIKLEINSVTRTTLYGVIACKIRKTDVTTINGNTIRERNTDNATSHYGIAFCNNDEEDDLILVACIRGITNHEVNYMGCKIKEYLYSLINDYPALIRLVITPLWVPFIDSRNTTVHTTCLTAIVLIKRNDDNIITTKIQTLFNLPAPKIRNQTITIGHAVLEIRTTLNQFHNVPLIEQARKRNYCLRISNMTYVTVEELLVGSEKVVKRSQVKSIFYEQDSFGAPVTYYLELIPSYSQALTLVFELDKYAYPETTVNAEFMPLLPAKNKNSPLSNLFQINDSLLYNPNLVIKNISGNRK